ncbi:translation initiation factor IF3-4, chloroplastic-like [Rhododendron vialii]|uniref:translation initiation factor IF3-4, chloroplastic-like n=1 Tax=Rhododendron vialii TaxID=182163 RepID=UPI00265F8B14|nr:translation initiation factor IF3-4, chloroplastic-like [Rhododendron vialii]
MARLTTSTFPFKPTSTSTFSLLSRLHKPPPPPPPLSLSLNSNIFELRLCYRKSPSLRTSITARYGGGGGGGSSRDDYGSRQEASDDDEDDVLDISSIRSATVRLIDQKQNMVGVVSKNEAIQMAEDAELDLVILSPDANPPVVKIMNYSKYKYELQKKKRVQQKKSTANRMNLKELKMGYNIDVHDYAVRLKAANKFLKEGDKVKVLVNLKGRENQFRKNAVELLKRFQNDIGELATQETINLQDKNMYMVLVPNKAAAQRAQVLQKEKEKEEAKEVSAGV